MDVTAQPGSATTIHYHPEQEETYRVLEGALEVYRDEVRIDRLLLRVEEVDGPRVGRVVVRKESS